MLTLLAGSCASVETPPGGPPDFTAPALLSVTPDSGTVNPGLDDPIWFAFDEVVSEQSGGGLQNLFEISPRPRAIRVSWKRSRIGVKPREGWIRNAVYQVRLKKGVADLSNNRTTRERIIILSTGGEIPATVIAGKAIDWLNGKAASGASIEALRLPDSLAYTGTVDSAGGYRLTSIPRGHYRILTFLDQNRNDRRERIEAYDSIEVDLDSTAAIDFWLAQRDTIGPRVRGVSSIDSLAFSVEFNQPLDTVPPGRGSVRVLALPDSVELPVSDVMFKSTYDSVAAELKRLADTAAVPDSLAVPDTAAVADTAAVEEVPDSSDIQRLLARRPRLETGIAVQMVNPLAEGGRYLVFVTVTNLLGAGGEVRGALNIPKPEPRDSL